MFLLDGDGFFGGAKGFFNSLTACLQVATDMTYRIDYVSVFALRFTKEIVKETLFPIVG